MIYRVHVETPHAMCGRVQTMAALSFGKLNMLPYNHYAPEESDWWLSPSSASPAYRHTKYYFGFDLDQDGKNTGLLTVGLHAEKGLGEVTRTANPGTRGANWIMAKDWEWFQFIKLVRSGKLLNAMAAATTALGQPVVLELQVGYPPDPEVRFDPESLLKTKARAVYRFDLASNDLCLCWPVRTTHALLTALPRRLDRETLSAQLEELTQNDWVWVDCYVYALFHPHAEAAPADQLWETNRVWTYYLSTFSFAIG